MLVLFSITCLSRGAPAQDYSALVNRTIDGAKVLLAAREVFSQARSLAEEDNTTAWWNSALEDKNSSNLHQELAYICNHISYLDMLSVANATGELPNHRRINSDLVQTHTQNAYRSLCGVWVSHQYASKIWTCILPTTFLCCSTTWKTLVEMRK